MLLTNRDFHVGVRLLVTIVHHVLNEHAHLGDRHGDHKGVAILAGLETTRSETKGYFHERAPHVYYPNRLDLAVFSIFITYKLDHVFVRIHLETVGCLFGFGFRCNVERRNNELERVCGFVEKGRSVETGVSKGLKNGNPEIGLGVGLG